MLSVVLRAHNAAATIGEQLDALAAQEDAAGWELVVVDNRCDDATMTIVDAHRGRLPAVVVAPATERLGGAYAGNVGVRAARGDRLAFCDADDIVGPRWVAAMQRGLGEHALVSGRLDTTRLNGDATWRPPPPNGPGDPVLGFLPYVIGCNLGVDRGVFESVGGFDESIPIGDDVALAWSVQLAGHPIHEEQDALVYYRYRHSAWGMFSQTVRYAEAHVHLFRRFRHHGMPRSSVRAAVRRWAWLARQGPYVLSGRASAQHRADCLHKTAACVGRLKGTIACRTLYP